MLLVDIVSQLAYPRKIPMYNWYSELIRLQGQMTAGHVTVADYSRLILDLSDLPAGTRPVYDNFDCTQIDRGLCRVKDDCIDINL